MNIHVRCLHLDNSEHVDRHAREKLWSALSRFEEHVGAVDLLVEDVHGPKHGMERRCVVRVLLSGANDVRVEHVHPDVYRAIEGAARRVKRTVRRRINRRRDKVLHRQSGTRAAA